MSTYILNSKIMISIITLLFKHFGLKNFMSISAIIWFLTNQFFSRINIYFYILIIMYQIIIMYFLFSLCEAVYNYINIKLSLKKFKLQYRRVYNGATVLEGNILFPMGIVALIGKIIGSFYQDHDDISVWNQDIKYVFIIIIVGLILNLLWDKLHYKDSSPKASTKTKTSVPTAFGSGGDSNESNDDSNEKKSRWEKVKTFCYDHRWEIAIGVISIISLIYGIYSKPPTDGPDGGKPPTDSPDGGVLLLLLTTKIMS
jgi:hypothetical protein